MIYLIHFDPPFKHARHYLGYTQDLKERETRHQQGRGSSLMDAVTRAGIKTAVVRVWPKGDRTQERHLKNIKNTPRLCPVCNPGGWQGHGQFEEVV